jgi:hypothetical protein
MVSTIVAFPLLQDTAANMLDLDGRHRKFEIAVQVRLTS